MAPRLRLVQQNRAMENVSFQRAQEIVRALNEPDWTNSGMRGTYMIADYGLEDHVSYLIIDGPKEYLVDGDLDFALVGNAANIVNKTTGAVLYWNYLDHMEEIDAMKPVPGHEPPE